MIGFNGHGLESMTGEPNTWHPRVSMEEKFSITGIAQNVPDRRGIDAAFALAELAQAKREALEWKKAEAEIESAERTNRARIDAILRNQPPQRDNWHQQQKQRHAKRREMNLRYKKSDREA